MVVVIRDIELWVIAAQSALTYVAASASGLVIPLIAFTTSTASQYHQWQGRVVLAPGDEIVGASSTAGVQVWVSGYLLSG
jgi:hypothetical protein